MEPKTSILDRTIETTSDVVIATGHVVGDVAEATINIAGAIVVTALTVVVEIGPSLLIAGALID
tara:strand:+ start:560 stop:751 length:192 start_codon:yes stop_codon:yes gene_type:complete